MSLMWTHLNCRIYFLNYQEIQGFLKTRFYFTTDLNNGVLWNSSFRDLDKMKRRNEKKNKKKTKQYTKLNVVFAPLISY